MHIATLIAGVLLTAAEGPVVETHVVRSEYQAGDTVVRVLRPEPPPREGERLPVVYVLPVEAKDEHRYGDGLREVGALGLHRKHRVFFVAPTFSHLPWYADHPTDPTIRQESHILRAVVPLVEEKHPVLREKSGRLLLGFSKSGWGAFCLLLRHPDVFGAAAAWDAPLMMDRPGLYGSGPIFGGDENFAAYRVSSLVERRGRELGNEVRLTHLGYGNFRDEHTRFEALLGRLGVPHRYIDGPKRPHAWDGGWLAEAVGALMEGGGR